MSQFLQINHALIDLKGRQLLDGAEPLTLRAVLVGALLNAPDSAEQKPEDKRKRFRLAQRIEAADKTVHVSAEETKLLMDLVGISFSTLVTGLVFDMLDPPQEQLQPPVVIDGSRSD
jgi:hypothetical protein